MSNYQPDLERLSMKLHQEFLSPGLKPKLKYLKVFSFNGVQLEDQISTVPNASNVNCLHEPS